MKAARIVGPNRVELTDVPTPRATGDLVVVKVLVAPLCTEFKDRAVGSRSEHVGHEAAGVVVDPGGSRLVGEGDRVVVMPQNACGRCWLCRRGDHIHCPDQRDVLAESGSSHGVATLAEYVIKPDWLLVKVPEKVSLTHAAMACCGFGPTFTALQRTQTTALSSVVVSGCGAVGLGGVVQGVSLAADVLAFELHPYRAELALKLGARAVIDPRDADAVGQIADLTGGRGAEIGIETSGAAGAAWLLSNSLQRRGRMGVVAWTAETSLPAMAPSGLDVFGCWHWNHQRYTSDMMTMIAKAAAGIDMVITHRFPLAEVDAAMELQATGACGKVMLYPFGEDAAA